MSVDLDVDLEKGLAADEVQAPLPAVVQERQRRGTAASGWATLATIHKPRWVTPRLISKTGMPDICAGKQFCNDAHVSLFQHSERTVSDFEDSQNGFPLGTFSDEDFCERIRNAPSHVQNSVVCDVIWWRSNKPPLHHQFLILTVAHQQVFEKDHLITMYDIRVERVGKGVNVHGNAEHKITIVPAQLAKVYRDNSKVLFGLTDALPHLRSDIEGNLPDECVSVSAFVDKLDDKWRGPPATLWHIARYVDAIVKLAPRYDLGIANCYYFARTLFYIIGLRHYSFHYLVSEDAKTLEIRSPMHDPSSISMLFRFFHKEEEYNGVLLYKYTVKWTMILLGIAVMGIVLLCIVEVSVRKSKLATIGLNLTGGLWAFFQASAYLLNAVLVLPFQRKVRRRTERLVRILGELSSSWLQFSADSYREKTFRR